MSKTLLRGLGLIEVVDLQGPLTISEIARHTGIELSTVSRTVAACEPDGWLVRVDGRIATGPRCALLGLTSPATRAIRAAEPLVRAITAAVGVTTTASTLAGRDVMVLASEMAGETGLARLRRGAEPGSTACPRRRSGHRRAAQPGPAGQAAPGGALPGNRSHLGALRICLRRLRRCVPGGHGHRAGPDQNPPRARRAHRPHPHARVLPRPRPSSPEYPLRRAPLADHQPAVRDRLHRQPGRNHRAPRPHRGLPHHRDGSGRHQPGRHPRRGPRHGCYPDAEPR